MSELPPSASQTLLNHWLTLDTIVLGAVGLSWGACALRLPMQLSVPLFGLGVMPVAANWVVLNALRDITTCPANAISSTAHVPWLPWQVTYIPPGRKVEVQHADDQVFLIRRRQ